MPKRQDDELNDLRFAFGRAAADVMKRHYLEDAAGARLSWKFKLYYQLRPFVPILLRHLLQRRRNSGMHVQPDWYLPTRFISDFKQALQRDLETTGDEAVIHPWPDGHRFSIVLTHDVETSAGVKSVDQLASLEERYGFRSCWNFVPYKYDIDPGLVSDLGSRGHEIGIHGYNHDGKLFTSARTFKRRTPKINQALQQYESIGFRAPMVHRNLDWIEDLEIEYDASCFDIDPFQAMPGGVGSIWPFIKGKLVELPYTLPQDHTLFVALQDRSDAIWTKKTQFLREWSGMAMFLTHPDYLNAPTHLSLYESMLAHLREFNDAWSALPREVAAWWRARATSTIDPSTLEISGPTSVRGRVTNYRELFGPLL